MDNAKKMLRTPLIKPRAQGGTFYTFASALEDIGLNINELGNKVMLSHYALLDLPPFDAASMKVTADYSDYDTSDSSNAGKNIFADSFQNYVLNMETVVRNHRLYDFSNAITVSERVFWKWLLNNGLLHLKEDEQNSDYYVEDCSYGDTVVKCFGYINSGAQRSDDYSMYNETFVQVPSSFGRMRILFKPTEDDNYYRNNVYESSMVNSEEDELKDKIEYITASELDSSMSMIQKTGISAKAIFDTDSSYIVNSDTDLLTIELSLDKLRQYYNEETLTYDDLAIHNSDSSYLPEKPQEEELNTFNFNAALIYYSVYDSTGKNILATNAYGLLLFDDTEIVLGENEKYRFYRFTKKQATSTKSGTSYSFRLNIKASSIYSGDITVNDNSTPAYSMSTDFNDTIKNLNTAIEILRTNANHLAVIESDYRSLKQFTIDALGKEEELERVVNDLKQGLFKKIDASVLHVAQISIGDGITFSEDVSSGLFVNEDTVGLNIGILNASDVNASDVTSNSVSYDTCVVSDTGTNFVNNENVVMHVGPEGVSGSDIYAIQDRTDSSAAIDSYAIDEALDRISVIFADNNLLINVDSEDVEGVAGEILNTIYDSESKRLNLKGLCALLLAKIKES